MNTITGKIDEHLEVREDTILHGMATKGLTVLHGTLRLHGMCIGDLAVTGTGEAEIYGMVIGNVVNDATVTIHGVVKGNVYGPGDTTIADGAVVGD